MYQDKTLVCRDCGAEFVFTAGEQEFYAERGFQNEPQRCKACRDARKQASRGPREYFTAVCAACGSGAGIAWMLGNDYQVIEKTVVNVLANVGGIVCDGAKPSCAAKISSAVEAALNAYYMAVDEQGFRCFRSITFVL